LSRGVLGVRLPQDAAVPAPVSGVHFGAAEGGPVSLRLFRLAGTRVVVVGTLAPAQLLAVRVAAAGTPVQVVTTRPQFWEPLLPRELGAQVVRSADHVQPSGGPSLVVDDRPAQPRTNTEVLAWQCRLDVRSEWSPAELPSFAYTDVAVLGRMPADLTGVVASSFGLAPRVADRLAHLDGSAVALLRRGRLEPATIDPTPAERQLLEAGRHGATAPAPVWR
jgi:hypothetical protein